MRHLLLLLFLFSTLSAEVVNRVILRVNDRIATLYDYERLRAERLQAILQQPSLDPGDRQRFIEESGKMAMREIFDGLLILSRADQLGVTVSERQIDEQLTMIREQNSLQSDAEFAAALAQSGMTLAQLRERYRREMMINEVMAREVAPRTRVEEEQLRRYYREHLEEFRVPEQIRLREIVVLGEGEAAQELARQIHEALLEGQSLDSQAELHAPQVSQVIDPGWVAPGDLDPTLERAIWNLAPGEYSEPIPARGGLHICQLLERQESHTQSFNEVQEEILMRERQRLMADEYQIYLRELEEKSYIRGTVPEEAQGFQTAAGRSLLDDQFPLLKPGGPEEAIEGTEAVEAPPEAAEPPPPLPPR